MKYVIVIPDGAPDEPLEALGGRTPLQAAGLPALDWLAARGRLGTASTVAKGRLPTEADVHLGVVGYDPERHRAGEGALSAYARGLDVNPEDQVFCCNLVTVIDSYLRDFTAGFISPAEARPLIDTLNAAFGSEPFRFHACKGYRNLCVWESAGALPKLQATAPDTILNQAIKRHMPRGSGSQALRNLILKAHELLREHDVNLVRQDLGENPATAIWLWGHGPLPALPSFQQRYGVRGALIADSDVVRGIGRLIGWEVLDTAATSGPADGDYCPAGRAAVDAVDSFELVCVHTQTPHTLALLGHVAERTSALEAIDREIVAPLLERLRAEREWRMLVIPGWAASVGQHPELGARTPFVLAGSGIESNRGEAFDEESAAAGELHPNRASDLMEYFLRR